MAFLLFNPSPPFLSSSRTPHNVTWNPSIIVFSNPFQNFRISRRRISVSFASIGEKPVEASWIPADGNSIDSYGGWLIAESTVVKSKRELPLFIFGVVAASVSILLTAVASRSLPCTGYKYRFNVPLHGLQELFSQVPISAPVASEAILEQSSSQMSNKVDDECMPASIEKMQRVIIPVAPDSTQQEAVAVLKKLKIMEEDVKLEDLCTRRLYARWMVKLNSLLERNPKYRIVPSMLLAGSTVFAFDDVSVEDPDFWSIQALAEAGIVPSKLYAKEVDSNGFKDQQRVEFLPESFVSRIDLVDWRAQLEYSLIPGIDEKSRC